MNTPRKPNTGRPQQQAYRDVKPRTREGYRALLTNHIKPTLGDTPIGELTAPDVRTWYAELATGATAKAHAYQLLRSARPLSPTDCWQPTSARSNGR